MKIFDLHADLAEAIKPFYTDGKTSILKKDWSTRFKQGQIAYTSAASFFVGWLVNPLSASSGCFAT